MWNHYVLVKIAGQQQRRNRLFDNSDLLFLNEDETWVIWQNEKNFINSLWHWEFSCSLNNLKAYVLVIRKYRSSHPKVFCKKGILKISAKFTRKHLCWRLFSIRLQAFKPETLLKRDTNTGAFTLAGNQNTFFYRAPPLQIEYERLS